MLRLHYNLPPGDPRVLAWTEEDVVQELLTLHFRAETTKRLADPQAHAAEEAAKNEGVWAQKVANADAFLADPFTQRFLAEQSRNQRPAAPPPVKVQRAKVKIPGRTP